MVLQLPVFIASFLGLVLPSAVAFNPPLKRLPLPAAQSVDASWTFDVTADAGTDRFVFTVALPRTLADRQTVRSLRINPQPSKRWIEAGTEYAQFDLRRPGRVTRIDVTAQMELYRADLHTLARQVPATRQAETDYAAWLKPEPGIESDDPAIVALAASLPPAAGAAAVRDVMQATLDHLKPGGYSEQSRGAVWALANGTGDCSEFSDFFVATCRARGVPAFVVEGYVITPLRPGDTPRHAWAEAHIDGVGWAAFDPYHVAGGWAAFDQLSPTRIITNARRNDPTLEGHHHWAYRYWGKPVTVQDTFTVKNVRAIASPPASRPADTR